MTRMKKLFAASVALMLALCMGSAALAEGAIKIGVIGPLSGGAAIYGLAVQHGAEVAAAEINALGGLQVELNAQDDQNTNSISINAYNRVLEDGAQMILGTVTTGPCGAVATEAYAERVFMLTPSASSELVTEGNDNVFQVCFTDPAQGVASAQMIAEKKLGTKIGIIYNSAQDYSVGIYEAFKQEAATLGLEIVAETSFQADDTVDFSIQVATCKEKGADLVFLPIYYTPASLILAQCQKVGYSPVFFGVDGMDGILTVENFDTTLAEGVLLLSPFSADTTDEKTVKFVEAYKAAYNGEVPNQFAADAYDGIYALYAAVQAAGITPDTPYDEACELLIAQFKTLKVEGLTGVLSWDESGAVSKVPNVYRIEGGKYVKVE